MWNEINVSFISSKLNSDVKTTEIQLIDEQTMHVPSAAFKSNEMVLYELVTFVNKYIDDMKCGSDL